MDQGCHRNSVSAKNVFLRNARFLTSTTGRSPLDLFDPNLLLAPRFDRRTGAILFPRHEVLTVAWPPQADLLFYAALPPDEAVLP